MQYHHNIDNGVFSLALSGDLIGEDSGLDLIEVVSAAIEQQVLNAVINIAGVRYINSSGIGVLITILTKFRNKGGEVYLVKPSESVKKLLIITKLTAIFNIVEDQAEALSKIKETS